MLLGVQTDLQQQQIVCYSNLDPAPCFWGNLKQYLRGVYNKVWYNQFIWGRYL